jgi:hypothetical protein
MKKNFSNKTFVLNRNLIINYLIYFFLFLFGIGTSKVSISLFSIFGLYFYVSKRINIILNKPKVIFGLMLWIFILVLYYSLYIPPLPPEGWDNMNIEFWSYFLKSSQVILAYAIISTEKKQMTQFVMLMFISLGMLFFALLTSVFTLIYLDPPYYGKALHPFHKVIMNSPGTTILGGIASITMLSFLTEKNYKLIDFILIAILVTFLGILISFLYSARTLFLVFAILSITRAILYLHDMGLNSISRNKYFLSISILVTLFLFITYSNIPLLVRIKDRILYGEYMVKVQHSLDYWSQIKNSFWIYPKAEFTYRYNNWFHNFFFDIHRTSGPITAIAGYILLIYTFGISIRNMFRRTYLGRELLVLYITFFPYLYTSIPWESGENQMITFYAALTAMILSDKKETLLNYNNER